jgi:nucleoside-diphosphate-sugar epimerase
MNHGLVTKSSEVLMSKPRIAILGASGFVGATLVERLFFEKSYDFTAFIHSFGNAARIARLPIQIESIDILNYDQINQKLSNYNIVINCTRGGSAVMMRGLKNIVKAAKNNKIDKFVHIGSISIYGEVPPPESKSENASPNPGANPYGIGKLNQDNTVFRLHDSGVPSIILCPSNITGPYSPFLLSAAEKLLSNEILLVDDGKNPTNLIHVDNLVEAIIAAIESDTGWGERYFVNEIEQTNWKTFYEELSELLGLKISLKSISSADIVGCNSQEPKSSALKKHVKVLFSKNFRKALTEFPSINALERNAINTLRKFKPETQKKILSLFSKPTIIREEGDGVDLNSPLIKVQTRKVYHSPEKIISKLNYKPLLNHEQRRASISSWLRFINIEPQRN